MKRIAIFISLKIAEVAVVVFVPYLVGSILTDESGFDAWSIGMLMLIAAVAAVAVVVGVIGLAGYSNWILSKKLAPKIPKSISILLAVILIVGAVYFSVSPKPKVEEITPDANDFTITIYEPQAQTIEIYTTSGSLILEIGDELKIVGDANMNEGAAVFFHRYIKELADAYIKSKLPIEIDATGSGELKIISECPHCGRSLHEPEPLADK